MRSLLDYLNRENRSARIVYPSSVVISDETNNGIREQTGIHPHNEYEVTLATAENWLYASSCETDCRVLAYVVRLGEIYGSEMPMDLLPGLINGYVRKAERKSVIGIPGLGASRRSLCFIGDACEAAIHVLQRDFPPQCFNVPGERYAIIDVVAEIMQKFDAETEVVDGKSFGCDYSPYAGNKVVSGTLYKKLTDYRPAVTFKRWLAGIK